MALSFPRFSWPWIGGNQKEPVPNGSIVNSLSEMGFGLRGESESLKFYSSKGVSGRAPSSKVKRKLKSRKERSGRIDREYDLVLVPSDGVSLSDSESDDSDWSIGWLEPHAPGFQVDDEDEDDSFAVLVPCYKQEGLKEEPNSQFFNAAKNHPTGDKEFMHQWLSSLQNF